jgi:hypothetical protein
MGNAHKKAELPGRSKLGANWHIGNELVAYGRKPADWDPAAFQGIHARHGTCDCRRGRRSPEVDLRCVDAPLRTGINGTFERVARGKTGMPADA